MDESRIDIPQTPEITEKTEDEGGKTIDSSMQKSIDNRPGSSQPPEIANYQVAIPAQSNNVPRMFPLGLFHRLPDRPENIESLLLARDRQCNFEELVKNMIDDTLKIRKWYAGVEWCLGESNTELCWGRVAFRWRLGDTRVARYSDEDLGRMIARIGDTHVARYSDEDLGRMMARSGLLLLEFLRFLALPDLPRSSKEFFQPKERQLSVQEAVLKIDNRIPIFVLKKILEWERDADKDENRLGSDGDADKDENRGCMQIKMKTGERDADKDENRQADTDLHSILKHAWLKLSPIVYDDSLVIDEVQLKDDSHLLEFLYENIIGSSDFKHACKWRKNKRRVRHISLPQAEQLQGKGVKFAPNEGLLDKICFNRSTLYLPTIKMDGGTAAVLRNLVLFEASKQEKRSQPLMSYVDLMERLIDTPEDVQALIDGGIIECHLATNNEVANVCNGMRRLLLNKKIKYEPIDKAIYDLRRIYTSKCRIMYSEFKQIYCSKPWIVLSVISACILFALLHTYLAWEQVRLQRESMPKT